MKKQIVSETKQYQPSFPDALLLDDTPKVNSFNGVTSDAVARAVAGASGEVPQVTENDNGKVLKAIYDEGGPAVEWGEATVDQTYDATSTNAQSGVAVAGALAGINQVPNFGLLNARQFLTVDELGEHTQWAGINQVPASTSYDADKVLTVNAQGTPAWATAGGGSSYTAGNGIDITANEVSVKAGTGLEFGNTSATVTKQTVGLTQHINSSNYDSVNVIQQLTPEIFAAIGNNTATVTLSTIPVTDPDSTNWYFNSDSTGATAYVVIGKLKRSVGNTSGWDFDASKVMYLGVAVQTLDASNAVPTGVAFNVHASDDTDTDSTLTWSELTTALAGGTISDYAIFIAYKSESIIGLYPIAAYCSHITGVVDGTVTTGSITYTATIANSLKVSNPLPASAVADANKVLTVNAQGTPEWAVAQGGGGSSSRSQFDTAFNLTYDSSWGNVWRLSTDRNYRLDLTGGPGVYAYQLYVELYEPESGEVHTAINGFYAVTVSVGNSRETHLYHLAGEGDIGCKGSGILDISFAQSIRGTNVYVLIQPTTSDGTPIPSTFTEGSVTLTLAKLSTLSGGWQQQQ